MNAALALIIGKLYTPVAAIGARWVRAASEARVLWDRTMDCQWDITGCYGMLWDFMGCDGI